MELRQTPQPVCLPHQRRYVCHLAYQTYLIREQQDLILKEQYASVLPHLSVYLWKNGPEDYSIKLVNNGVGPAFIQSVKIYYRDTTYNFGVRQFFDEIIASNYPESGFNYSSFDIYLGSVIPAGHERELIRSLNKKTREAIVGFFGGKKDKAIIEITYSSVYEETWVVKSSDFVPEKLE